jgi:hypothetical protein
VDGTGFARMVRETSIVSVFVANLNKRYLCFRSYPGIVDALNFSESPIFIVTTKEKRFVCELLKHGGVELEEQRIFGLDSGSKLKVLKSILQLDEVKGRTL